MVSNRRSASGELGLRADAVGRGDEQRLAVARRDRERATEPAETADDLGPAGRFDVRPHELDRGLAGRDVDAGRAVGVPARLALGAGTRHRPTTASSSMNLRLVGVVRDGFRVVAVEAGEAEPLVRQVERGEHAADREVAERIGADELADLGLGVGRGDELGLDLRVDAVEARVVDRRGADPDVDLGRAGLAQQLDDPLRRRPADDRIVDDDRAACR